jgi:hypothetical protein
LKTYGLNYLSGFGIFDYDFTHDDAGETGVTFLFHQKTGRRLAVFMAPELAVEGVALIEDAPDWDETLLSPSRLEPLVASPFTPPACRSAGSHVPYESLVELRAVYMPDAARAISGIPRADPEGRVTPRF